MGKLIAKLRDGTDCVVASLDDNLYETDTNITFVSYDYRYKLDENEWFELKGFSRQTYGRIVLDFNNTTDFNRIDSQEYGNIKYLVFIDKTSIFFEKITPAKILHKKILDFSIANEPSFKNNPKVIIFNAKPDAVYNQSADTLHFKSLNTIKDIFQNIDVLYREATDEETQKFVSKSCVALGNGFSITEINSANRKRITMAWENYQKWGDDLKSRFIKYAHKYCAGIQCDNDKFIVTNEKELKQVLYAMDERYYTTELQEEKRLANSVQLLE